MKQFLLRRWFLILLIVALATGSTQAKHLQFLIGDASLWSFVRQFLVALVLFLMALPLEASSMWHSLKRPWAALLAVIMNFGFLPLFAWLVSRGLSPPLAAGLLLAAATPCTLASASVWTRRAGGNDAVSILVTMFTNLSCFVITPLWLVALTGQTTRSISLSAMIVKLGLLVVLPMLLAQLLRLRRPIGTWATRNKISLSTVAQCGILYMVLLGAVQSGLRMATSDGMILGEWVALLMAVVLVHVGTLSVGFWTGQWLGFTRADCIAVGFAGSQKTLMVGLQVAIDTGIDPLPMVIYHVSQLFIDTVIADRWRAAGRSNGRSDGKSGDKSAGGH